MIYIAIALRDTFFVYAIWGQIGNGIFLRQWQCCDLCKILISLEHINHFMYVLPDSIINHDKETQYKKYVTYPRLSWLIGPF